jgi:hypothetical protein
MVGSTSGSQGDVGRALEEEMRASLVNGKLPCAVAFKIAKKLKVSPKQVGDAANRLNIKISSCQMGCFP